MILFGGTNARERGRERQRNADELMSKRGKDARDCKLGMEREGEEGGRRRDRRKRERERQAVAAFLPLCLRGCSEREKETDRNTMNNERGRK